MQDFDVPGLLHDLSILALPVLIAITTHEAAHGFVALTATDGNER